MPEGPDTLNPNVIPIIQAPRGFTPPWAFMWDQGPPGALIT